jgi:predicted Zn finger-like uncharacterized protein
MNTQTPSNMVITVTCPSCSSSFPVDPNKVPEGGVNARCSACGDIFRVEKPAAAPPLPTLEDVAPEPPPPAAEPDVQPYEDSEPHIPALMDDAPAPEAVAHDAAVGMTPPPLPEVVPEAEEAPSEALPTLAASLPPVVDEAVVAEPETGFEASPAPVVEAPEPPAHEPPALPEAAAPVEPSFGGPTPMAEPLPAPAEPEGAAPSPETEPVQGFRFGKRDPTDKAKRLARVLVSDMIMYNAERHQSALAAGTLVQDFEDEIEKSWKEFVEQVGADLASGPGRTFWIEALNDILAKGQKVF